MPDGWTHSADTLLATTATSILIPIFFRVSIPHTVAILAGCLTNLIMSPDLDVDGGFLGFHVVRKFAGGVVGGIWRVVWWPYAKLIPHRSKISHSLILGTAIRVAYLLVLLSPALYLLHVDMSSPLLGYWFVGLCLMDSVHVMHDLIHTKLHRHGHHT